MYTVFNREPFTAWKIVIVDRTLDKTLEEIEVDDPNCSDYMEFFCTYRTTTSDGKECEQFSIILNENDYCLFQIKIFKNENVEYFSEMPINVSVNKRVKRIEILPLAYCKVINGNQVHFEHIE